MRRLGRWTVPGVTAVTLAVAGPLVVAAASNWTLTISPGSATVGTSRTFTLTATNVTQGGQIGCVVVDVPASFSISGTSMLGASDGAQWTVGRSGNRIIAQAASGNRIDFNEFVRIGVTATPTQSGAPGWPSMAHTSQACGGQSYPGDAPAVSVSDAPSTPQPTPQPTPPPTPKPTAAPTPRPGSPAPGLPTSPPGPPGASEAPGSTASPGASATPSESSSPTPTPAASGGVVGDGGGPAAPTGQLPGGDGIRVSVSSAQVTMQVTDPTRGIDLSAVALELGAGSFAVPAAVIAGPGLLLLIWFGLQTVGMLGWLPAVRRLRGDDRPAGGAIR